MKIINYIRNSRMISSGDFIVQLRKKLNIKTRKKELYQKAFTHSSLNLKDKQGNSINFERLEFLGDALLSTIIAEYLFNFNPKAKEGKLTKLRAKIVSRVQLNYIGKDSLDFAQQIADFYTLQALKNKKEPQLQVIKNASNQ